MFQFDVKNALLHGDLEEEVYMDTPLGFQMSGAEGKMCRLKRALYALKQLLRVWFERFQAAMFTNGYKQCQADHTLFIKREDRKMTALIVYVDDIVVIGNDEVEVVHLKSTLTKEFEI